MFGEERTSWMAAVSGLHGGPASDTYSREIAVSTVVRIWNLLEISAIASMDLGWVWNVGRGHQG